MKNISFNLSSIHDFKNVCEECYSNLETIINNIENLNSKYSNMVNSVSGNAFKEFFNNEIKQEKNEINEEKNIFNYLFNNQILPSYEELVNETAKSIGE